METGNAPGSQPVRVTFDATYIINITGILKILQIILNLIGFILIQASGIYAQLSRAVYYSFVSGTGFCISIILLILHLFHITEVTSMIPWFKVEFVYCVILAFFHLIAGFVTIGLINGYFNTAGYIAFSAMSAYVLEAIYHIIMARLKKN